MTICEKFKLMMASFADIRAAIVEKGGTVTGGYADYAKNIEIYILMIHMHPNINIRLKNRQLCSI